MITKIEINKIASYKNTTNLNTNKKINLIYGLNGAGKTTISNYLYDVNDQRFSHCSIDGFDTDTNIFVYNQQFIQDNFYHSNELKGIFTLSKENKQVEEEIAKLIKVKKEKELEENTLLDRESKVANSLFENKKKAESKIWDIKTNYSGRNNTFQFCLDKLMGSKSSLFNHIINVDKPNNKPNKSIDDLQEEAKELQDKNAQPYEKLNSLTFTAETIENNLIFQKVIVGNDDSVISELIKKLKNTDWVKNGLSFLPEVITDREKCPFCQEETITEDLYLEIQNYFDVSYENDIKTLKKLQVLYENQKANLPNVNYYIKHLIMKEDAAEFEKNYNQLINKIEQNIKEIENKVNAPSKKIELASTTNNVNNINEFLEKKNQDIERYNEKLRNKQKELENIKIYFWKIMRWDYDQTIDGYLQNEKKLNEERKKLETELSISKNSIDIINVKISEEQRKTVNIEEAIDAINSGLSELGITGFLIEKYSNNKYLLKRNDKDFEQTFFTLSEGEKMIISFLYFVELCRGKLNPDDTISKKIIVIDDPMSSLSHLFVFNIAQLIKREFLNGDYEQVFVLTHSLYFFYELTDTNHTRRKEKQNLFRVLKNIDGSFISEMKYEEIQNDYQAYWMVINDDNQHPALIANSMRNVIEYFFNFVEKTDFNNIFQKKELKDDRFISFNRYMNRESHSLGQNIFDYKEFDYSVFKDGLKFIFDELGYEEHYQKMAKI